MNDSRKPLDHWTAPEDAGRPLACLATSFTFEVDFFEQQCLARFLGLDWKRGEEHDLAFLIEQEEKLAETRVSVVVDRASATEGRSLRWDLLPVGVRGGVMHAKVCLLVWERCIRGVVGSANLTSAGYRRQLEAQIVLDVGPVGQTDPATLLELTAALRGLVNRAPGAVASPGPKRRAQAILDDADRRLGSFEKPKGRSSMRISVIPGGPSNPVLDRLDNVWPSGPARSATVMSPFFDASEGTESPAVAALVTRLASTGESHIDFVVAVEQLDSRVSIQAPRVVLDSVPSRVTPALRRLRFDDTPRPLHAKAIVLSRADWVVALIGSSNFTCAGLGLAPQANLEINVAVGARPDSREGKALLKLVPAGDEIPLAEPHDWAPEPAEEDEREPELPWGFIQALVSPGPPAVLTLRFEPEGQLPARWTIADHTGRTLLGSVDWAASGRTSEVELPLPDDVLPFFLQVSWASDRTSLRATWPVNVTETAALPPPEELRNLPVEALIRALASTRPLHESLADAMRRMADQGLRLDDELDPLRRFSGTGQLLRRAKEMSLALNTLRERLERPAGSPEALAWRLEGPFGPVALAEGLIARAEDGGAVPGETSFLLAEIALTLARVDWQQAGRLLPGGTRVARKHARSVLERLRELREQADEDPRLAAYVERAFTEARI